MLRCNPVPVAELDDSSAQELIQSEERFFRVFEGAWLFQALESFFEKAWDLRVEALKSFLYHQFREAVVGGRHDELRNDVQIFNMRLISALWWLFVWFRRQICLQLLCVTFSFLASDWIDWFGTHWRLIWDALGFHVSHLSWMCPANWSQFFQFSRLFVPNVQAIIRFLGFGAHIDLM